MVEETHIVIYQYENAATCKKQKEEEEEGGGGEEEKDILGQ
jgi:hypothetical protein